MCTDFEKGPSNRITANMQSPGGKREGCTAGVVFCGSKVRHGVYVHLAQLWNAACQLPSLFLSLSGVPVANAAGINACEI